VKIIEGFHNLNFGTQRCVLTCGNFDGVHRAHQQLLAQASLFAANTGGPVVVLTFEPHPLTIVAPDRAPQRLTLREEKISLLAQNGADVTVIAKSEPSLLGIEAQQFVSDIIAGIFHPTHLVEGPSFGFGKGREGTVHLLKELAPRYDFKFHLVDPVMLQIQLNDSVMVSSSLVRRLLSQGKVHRAALCLGRPYELIGKVIKGCNRGQSLGFPTANLGLVEQQLPADGVYRGYAVVDAQRYPAAINVGPAPTFESSPDVHRGVEAHLLDFQGSLYGRTLRIGFENWMRDQKRFESADALSEQLRQDVQQICKQEN